MSCCTPCCDPIITEIPKRALRVARVSEDFTADNVDLVLVDTADVEVTLPFQPPAGTTVTVASRVTGVTVVPGCESDSCGCNSSDDDEECDTFCSEEESVAVSECGEVTFRYFPGDPCASPPTDGVWTSTALVIS